MTCRQMSKSLSFLQAVWTPKFWGWTSSSTVLSQVVLGRPAGLLQSTGGRSAAAMNRWWSSSMLYELGVRISSSLVTNLPKITHISRHIARRPTVRLHCTMDPMQWASMTHGNQSDGRIHVCTIMPQCTGRAIDHSVLVIKSPAMYEIVKAWNPVMLPAVIIKISCATSCQPTLKKPPSLKF